MNKRLLSIDVLRGMTLIFMIIVNTPGSWDHVYAPLLHADWNGLTPTDYISFNQINDGLKAIPTLLISLYKALLSYMKFDL